MCFADQGEDPMIKKVDCHTHSSFSADSQTPLKDAVLRAKKLGLDGISFTDHLDLGHDDPEKIMTFDFAQRATQITQLQEHFKDSIKIFKGLEVGFQPHIIPGIQNIIKAYDFDVIICSVHAISRVFAYEALFYEGKPKHQAYAEYLTAIYESVATFDDFDIVGHIGYMCRYAPYQDKSLKYADHREIVDAILKKVIEKDKGIEVNTAGFSYNLGFTHPDFDIIQRYKELGGSIITLGSDAHDVQRIGDRFDSIIKRLAHIGFSHVAYFEKRTPIFIRI